MDTRSLRVFAALAGTLHFGRAAEQCNLSPSALSRVVKRLEQELGCWLFERTNRAVRLTAQGRRSEGVSVGDGVWMGAGAKILDGVRIGGHAIIGAGAVVRVDVPENAGAGGRPARILGRRGDHQTPAE